jgi:hypothetical protein
MNERMPNGFHPSLINATVFLAGTTLAYLKFFILDTATERWSLFSAASIPIAFGALVLQIMTLHRSLQIANDDPATFQKTVRRLVWSAWLLLGSSLCLLLSLWWQPLPHLTQWMNSR